MTRLMRSTQRQLIPILQAAILFATIAMAGGVAVAQEIAGEEALAQAPQSAASVATTLAAPPESPEVRVALRTVDGADRRLAAARAEDVAATRREHLEQARDRAAEAALVIEPELTLVSARIEELGPAPSDHVEAADIATRRAALDTLRSTLDSALKRARLIQVEADQALTELATEEAQAVAEEMNQRTRSPLSPALWIAAARDLPKLADRLDVIGAELRPGGETRVWLLIASLAFAIVLMGPAALALRILGRGLAIRRAEADGRLRRSVFAFWMLAVGFITPALAALGVMAGLHASGVLSPSLVLLGSSVILALFVGAYVVALTEALLLVDRDEWRMVRIDGAEARQLRPFGWIAAAAVVLGTSSDAFILFIQPPASIATAMQSAIALLCVGLIIGLLFVVGRIRAADDGVGGGNVFYGRVPTLLLILLWPASLFILLRGALGYVVWATQMALWLVWGGAVLLTWYLLARLIDDACRAFFSQKNRLARSAHARFGVKDNTLLQFGVLLSAALRLALLLMAGALLLVPFGTGFTSFIDLFALIGHGVTIGEIEISPAAILRALIVLFVVLAVFNLGRRWLIDSYLPTTSLDAGAVNSIGVITGYLGVMAAVLWSLAAFGVQVQQLAFLVSALSVGIGFGLQAITQNFISGLILLAERPVRIGDRVQVGDQAGRIGRISVRATQIIADDGSRLVVPNSELITKTVQTVASADADAPAIVRGEITVAPDADLDAVRDRLVAAAGGHDAVRASPPPAAYISAITPEGVVFAWTAAVAPSDDLERVRGEIWLAALGDLRALGLLSTPKTAPASRRAPRAKTS